VVWLKVKALSSSPSTTGKKKKEMNADTCGIMKEGVGEF
jgi:hypothetical protein